jgi:tetratricopeptide (TPR) repeat protein
MTIDYSKVCFVIMPFGKKPVGKRTVDFDRIYDEIFEPAIKAVTLPEGGKLRPARTDKDFFAGDIGLEMFEYLHKARFALADITGLNPNVMYEIGVRHTVRQSGTAIFRQSNSAIPFDINHIKAFPYSYRPADNAKAARALIRRVLRESMRHNRIDSAVQASLRQQQAEPRVEQLDALLLKAENAVRDFDRPAAIATLRRAIRLTGGDALLHMRLGVLLNHHGRAKDALTEFKAATERRPDYSDAWRERGVIEARLSKDGQGEKSLREAIRLNPEDFDALASLGGILRKRGQFDAAAAFYQQSVDVSGGHPYPLLMALKLAARNKGALDIDADMRLHLASAEQMRRLQAENRPPIDVPWSMFDLAEIRLYAGDAKGFLEWTRQGLRACRVKWQVGTFRSALQLLIDGGVTPPGLQDALPEIEARRDELPDGA